MSHCHNVACDSGPPRVVVGIWASLFIVWGFKGTLDFADELVPHLIGAR